MIHPTAIIAPSVRLGKGVCVGPYSVLSDCEIGDDCRIGPHVVIGGEAEHSRERWEMRPRDFSGRIAIGCNTIIREFTEICRPVNDMTFVGDDVYIMGHSYIAHDCFVEDEAVLSNGTRLGGFTRVMRATNLGMGVAVRQYSTIGPYSMVAANAPVVKDIPPLAKYIPNKPLAINTYAIHARKLPMACDGFAETLRESYYLDLVAEWDAKRFKDRPTYAFPFTDRSASPRSQAA
jgi:UDP-N-acetylglucosamine acyltransferase